MNSTQKEKLISILFETIERLSKEATTAAEVEALATVAQVLIQL